MKLQRLDDTDFLAQLEAVDAFVAQMYAYPGRTFGQLYHRFIKSNDLREGSFELDDRRIELSAIRVPVLIFGGTTDGIAPIPCVRAGVPLLTGAEEVRFEVVPGGHLGMLTGRAARGTTWQVLDEWFTQWASDRAGRPPPAAKAAAKPSRRRSARTPPALRLRRLPLARPLTRSARTPHRCNALPVGSALPRRH